MTKTDLTAAEKHLLREVDSVPDKAVSIGILRQACRHLSPHGFDRVLGKMVDRNLLGHTDDSWLAVTLTFGGMQAMCANGMEVQ